MAIMGLKSGMYPLVAARLQKWAILLMGYQYDLAFGPQDSTPMLMHFCDCSEEILPLEKEQNLGWIFQYTADWNLACESRAYLGSHESRPHLQPSVSTPWVVGPVMFLKTWTPTTGGIMSWEWKRGVGVPGWWFLSSLINQYTCICFWLCAYKRLVGILRLHS